METTVVKISQHKLRKYLELEAASKEFDALKKELKNAALDGAQIQDGPLVMQLDTQAGSRRPAWKAHYVEVAELFKKQLHIVSGDAAALEIIEKTKPGAPSHKLVVIDKRELVK